jgi:hypothetical protein
MDMMNFIKRTVVENILGEEAFAVASQKLSEKLPKTFEGRKKVHRKAFGKPFLIEGETKMYWYDTPDFSVMLSPDSTSFFVDADMSPKKVEEVLAAYVEKLVVK